jgi:hypothetical protein
VLYHSAKPSTQVRTESKSRNRLKSLRKNHLNRRLSPFSAS